MLRPAATPAPLRVVSLNLALFFVFALCALVLLTRTLVSVAQVQASINDSVEPATSGIVDDTALLSRLSQTNNRAARMLRAGRQINASLADVATTTNQIVTQIGQARTHTARIDGSVAGIAGSSPEVRRRVSGLQKSVATTDDTARQVASSLAGSDRAVASVSGSLRGARASLDMLLALVPAISQEARVMLRALGEVDGHLAAVYANGLVRLSNLLQLGGLLPRPAADGSR